MKGDAFRVELTEVNDDGDTQRVRAKGMPNEELVNLHRVQPHGFASNPVKGAHGVGIASGSRDKTLVFGGESASHRPKKIPEGGSIQYDKGGNKIELLNDKINLEGNDNPITLSGQSFEFKCGAVTMKLDATGLTITGGTVKHNGKAIDATHKHIGVTPGPATTGVPE